MPRISRAEFNAVPLRAHSLLAGVPLHDAWVVALPPAPGPVALADFNPLEGVRTRLPASARALFRLRFFLGRIFGLEAEPTKASPATSFAARLTPDDRARSLVPAGTPEGLFRVVYRFENESLVEVHNRTAHAAALSALAATPEGYRFYIAVYVIRASWLTPIYMALIDPFRRWIVYPAMLKNIRSAWLERAGRTLHL